VVALDSSPESTANVSAQEVVASSLASVSCSTVPQWPSDDEIEAILPASPGQVYMLAMWQKTEGRLFYPTFRYFVQADSAESITQAWNKTIRQHPVLRTSFYATVDPRNPIVQIVRKDSATGGSRPSQFAQPFVSLVARDASCGFDLDLSIHHALYDAVSLPLIIQDFQTHLRSEDTRRSQVTVPDFLTLSLRPAAIQTREAFWREYLAGIRQVNLPTSGPSTYSHRIEIFRPGLLPCFTQLEQIARREEVSAQALLFAAYAKVYLTLSEGVQDKRDVVLGIYLSSRSHLPDLHLLAAPTLNLVPLLVRAPQERDLLDVAREVHLDLGKIGTAENSAVGLWQLAQWTGVKIDTFVNFIKVPMESSDAVNVEELRVTERDDTRRAPREFTAEWSPPAKFEVPSELKDFQHLHAYHAAVDIELTETNGVLDVGLFSPIQLLDLEAAHAAMSLFQRLLDEFVRGPQG